ncbi:MAG: hypothetical protein QM809_10630 [Gordonia sp. (in: high G+C Gram-positive bacteria)]|uniref:hypothetical protein n=1 Tax=Gordonia sp. (in: high G+C Gram-positive bacteria) TaxID=84139 RepID=UPI0039E2D0DC
MLNPKFVLVFSGALMLIAAYMMVAEQQWKMLSVVLPLWLAILAFWLYRQRKV